MTRASLAKMLLIGLAVGALAGCGGGGASGGSTDTGAIIAAQGPAPMGSDPPSLDPLDNSGSLFGQDDPFGSTSISAFSVTDPADPPGDPLDPPAADQPLPTPEPATSALFGVGLIALGYLRFRVRVRRK